MNWSYDDILEYFRIADEGDGDAEPSLHATTVLAYRFVAKTAVEQIYTLQGVFYCLDEGMHITIKQKKILVIALRAIMFR
jgi:hypothetical protein